MHRCTLMPSAPASVSPVQGQSCDNIDASPGISYAMDMPEARYGQGMAPQGKDVAQTLKHIPALRGNGRKSHA